MSAWPNSELSGGTVEWWFTSTSNTATTAITTVASNDYVYWDSTPKAEEPIVVVKRDPSIGWREYFRVLVRRFRETPRYYARSTLGGQNIGCLNFCKT